MRRLRSLCAPVCAALRLTLPGAAEIALSGAVALAIPGVAVVVVPGVGEVAAQAPRWEVDANASRIQFDSAAALNAPSLSGRLEWRRPALFGRVVGSVTGFENAGWSSQARGDLSGWLQPLGTVSPLRLEVAGSGSASRHSSGFDSFVGRADTRLHVVRRAVGGWVGVGGGVARNSVDTEAVTGVTPSVGAWAQTGSVRATASYLHARISGETYPEGDLVLALTRGLLDLSVYGGFRRSPFDDLDLDESWVGASVAVWLHPKAAIVISGGQYASDVLQGLPGGDFVSIGFRLTKRRERPVPQRVTTPFVYRAETVRDRGIALEVPDASRVEIAGDFNGWQPEPLRRDASGRWVLPGGLEPGVYRFNLRVDGERWMVPEGVPSVDDSFGDRVGLLIISEG